MSSKAGLVAALGFCVACKGPSPPGVAIARTVETSSPAPPTSANSVASSIVPSAAVASNAPVAPEPNPREVWWTVDDSIGAGVARKDTRNPRGESVFVGFAGWKIGLSDAQAWVERLYEDDLRTRGVRYIYAVQGPADVWYDGGEIGTDALGTSIAKDAGPNARFVVFAAHSSGAYVAHALLDALAGGGDATRALDGKIVYFDLDGGEKRLTDRAVAFTRETYFVSVVDPATKNHTPHLDQMKKLAARYTENGAYLEVPAPMTKCKASANWCMHMALITTLPHDATKAGGPIDYNDFKDRAVAHGYLDVAAKAGLLP